MSAPPRRPSAASSLLLAGRIRVTGSVGFDRPQRKPMAWAHPTATVRFALPRNRSVGSQASPYPLCRGFLLGCGNTLVGFRGRCLPVDGGADLGNRGLFRSGGGLRRRCGLTRWRRRGFVERFVRGAYRNPGARSCCGWSERRRHHGRPVRWSGSALDGRRVAAMRGPGGYAEGQ